MESENQRSYKITGNNFQGNKGLAWKVLTLLTLPLRLGVSSKDFLPRCQQQLNFLEINNKVCMVFINVRELSKLIEDSQCKAGLFAYASNFQQRFNIKFLWEEYETLLDLATKINKREKGKKETQKRRSSAIGQIFTYGEYKLFSWALLIYSFVRAVELHQMQENDFQYLAKIFKQKTTTFIEYEVYCILWSREKYTREWEEQELQIFNSINNAKTTEEWKYVSYTLFCRSERKYFRPFQQCRQKWINYANPCVKKGDWCIQEDMELFTLIIQFGCRWALISRELKGTRSEHSIKNRYNSVVKSMRKQYKITSTQQVEEKILKYLRFRSNRRSKEHQKQEQLNISIQSKDSKYSRERSREVKLQQDQSDQSQSVISNEPINDNNEALFDDVFDVDLHLPNIEDDAVEEKILNLYISDQSPEDKKLKRTWEEEYEVIDGQISIANPTDNAANWWLSNKQARGFSGLDCEYYRFIGLEQQAGQIQPIMEQVREDIQTALGCTHYQKLMSDDWLFDGQWINLDE